MPQPLSIDRPPPGGSAPSTTTSLPSHPAPDSSATQQAAKTRPMDHANSWKPNFERRQSWNKEDQKRELHMSQIDDVKTGPGFSERG